LFSFTKLFRSRDAKAKAKADAAAAGIPVGPPQPTIYARGDHNVSRANISPGALKVLYRLKDSGYQGFLVGGAVRDLLLDLQPKDFDIATDAHPEDVRKTFRNSRLIGRRFHLAHVRFGHEIIEVATFRAAHTEADEDHGVDEVSHRKIDDSGRILRDNLYGTIEEDVWRRDFTANALYYNIEDFSICDYVGGVEDARNRVLRLIGDPATRYREDPVRMLRAARFAAKLDFTLHPGTEAPIGELAYMLDRMPPARLFDELMKLMLSGHGEASLEWLLRLDLLQHLLPDVAEALEAAPESAGARLLQLGLECTDQRVQDDKSVTPTFLFAVLLWPAILRELGSPEGPLPEDPQSLLDALDRVMGRQFKRIAVPKRFSLPMRELVMLQTRFDRRQGRRALRLLEHPRFRAAYDFLLLRAEAGEVDAELAQWWTDIQETTPADRIAMVEQAPRRAEGERGSGAATTRAADTDDTGPGTGTDTDAPRRRRRRRPRRKGGGRPPGSAPAQ
jgi:poly(A) polymerase